MPARSLRFHRQGTPSGTDASHLPSPRGRARLLWLLLPSSQRRVSSSPFRPDRRLAATDSTSLSPAPCFLRDLLRKSDPCKP